MKHYLRKLSLIFALTSLKENMFYTVSVDNTGINLQGKYHPNTVKAATALNFVINVDGNGYLIGIRDNIKIALTN